MLLIIDESISFFSFCYLWDTEHWTERLTGVFMTYQIRHMLYIQSKPFWVSVSPLVKMR